MITLTIGSLERMLESSSDIDEPWINEQINRQNATCVRVQIKKAGLDLHLATPGCGAGAGGGRTPEPAEQRIIDLWQERGLSQPHLTGGNLIAFLKQFFRL